MPASRDCPKCAGRMAEGFVLDNGHGTRTASRWFAGAPQKSIWTGLKLKGLESHDVATFRCNRCGYLESYAV